MMSLYETEGIRHRLEIADHLRAMVPTYTNLFLVGIAVLLIMCQVAIMTSDGCMTKATALLHCASSMAFITECLM